MKVMGIAGWSGAGKTVLITRLIPLLTAQGLRVSTVKHAHHMFDIDVPGKDSYEHRKAGASEVIVASERRVAQISELRGASEPSLADLLRRLSPCDLVLVEGYKRAAHSKLEVFRAANGRPALHPEDASIVAIATDRPFPEGPPAQAHLDDVGKVADLVRRYAADIGDVLRRLEDHGTAQ